jgi:hypothetical protein
MQNKFMRIIKFEIFMCRLLQYLPTFLLKLNIVAGYPSVPRQANDYLVEVNSRSKL